MVIAGPQTPPFPVTDPLSPEPFREARLRGVGDGIRDQASTEYAEYLDFNQCGLAPLIALTGFQNFLANTLIRNTVLK